MENLNLEALAADTAGKLHNLWDELGVTAEERDTFLAQLSADVATIYAKRVEHQSIRKSNVESEIAQLQATIESMQRAMEEAGSVVSWAEVARGEMIFASVSTQYALGTHFTLSMTI
jgi:hypothetical protein